MKQDDKEQDGGSRVIGRVRIMDKTEDGGER